MQQDFLNNISSSSFYVSGPLKFHLTGFQLFERNLFFIYLDKLGGLCWIWIRVSNFLEAKLF